MQGMNLHANFREHCKWGQNVIIRFWWESALLSVSQEPSHHFLQTFRPLRMFKIVFGDSSLYPKQ